MSEDTRISMRKAVFVALLSIAATFQAVAQSAKQALDKTQEKAADDDVARAALVDLQQKYTESQTQLATSNRNCPLSAWITAKLPHRRVQSMLQLRLAT
jgi:beta-lactamase regulating signal transducer with metallopeptidase domain